MTLHKVQCPVAVCRPTHCNAFGPVCYLLGQMCIPKGSGRPMNDAHRRRRSASHGWNASRSRTRHSLPVTWALVIHTSGRYSFLQFTGNSRNESEHVMNMCVVWRHIAMKSTLLHDSQVEDRRVNQHNETCNPDREVIALEFGFLRLWCIVKHWLCKLRFKSCFWHGLKGLPRFFTQPLSAIDGYVTRQQSRVRRPVATFCLIQSELIKSWTNKLKRSFLI